MFTLQQLNVQRTVATERERDQLLKKGFEEVEPETAAATDEKPVDDMTVPELKQHADDNGIDLKGATKKEDILAVIKGGGSDGD